ncbi:MAG: 4-(cytidine 5'-diphospho)-2-C-methyl-D-erythritol kinase [Bacteroidales bacterium]|nr:4-(cytidine 5'-diphospho)-2-C-methyl-D-erythritol kinase [Bacteroidales bacterium]
MKRLKMVSFPKAKINIGLRVRAKRRDGFHDIETIFYPVPLCDALEIVEADDPSSGDSITVTGLNTGGRPEDNLVITAIKTLRKEYPIPALKIHLHKAVPAGAGLGGGSSDSAFTLSLLNRQYGLALEASELRKFALETGSDSPFFIDPVPSWATGRGEVLNPVDPLADGFHLLLVNPGIRINTREAYAHCTPRTPDITLNELYSQPVAEWKNLIYNDFEENIFRQYPVIAGIKRKLYESGAIFSSMSGSGSTVYGIYSGKPAVPEEIKPWVICKGLL